MRFGVESLRARHIHRVKNKAFNASRLRAPKVSSESEREITLSRQQESAKENERESNINRWGEHTFRTVVP